MVAGSPDAISSRQTTTGLSAPVDATGAVPQAPDRRAGTLVTAEIPSVAVAPSYGVLLPDGSIWYPGSKRKLPAPAWLRVIVWTLGFLVLIAGAGLIVEHTHSAWLNDLRHTAGSATPPATTTGPGTTSRPNGTGTGTGTGTGAGSSLTQTGQSANGVTYSVPAPSYALVFSTTQPCYVQVRSEPSGTLLYSQTIPAAPSTPVLVAGNSAVVVAAGGASLSVISNGKTLGTIPKLNVSPYPFVYSFNATPTS